MRKKEVADIDVVADNQPRKQALLCECKWRKQATSAGEVQKLLDKAYLLPGYEDYQFIFFSKSPFTKAAQKLEKANTNLHLVTLDRLFE